MMIMYSTEIESESISSSGLLFMYWIKEKARKTGIIPIIIFFNCEIFNSVNIAAENKQNSTNVNRLRAWKFSKGKP